jgi:DNA-binding IclR family transcriptional regulator
MRVGIRAPLYASAAGRVLLAFAPADKRKDYLSRTQFKALTPSTRTTPESVLESLRSISTKGYCASFGEMLQDTAAIAVPVFDTGNSNIGALMVAAPLNRMRGNFDFLLGQLLQAGRQASGLHPDDPGPPAPDL